MSTIKITWVRPYHPATGYRGEETSVEFTYNLAWLKTDLEICDEVYHATNTGNHTLVLPANRTHTSISTFDGPIVDGEITQYGDIVSIDGRAYECAPIGWKQLVS